MAQARRKTRKTRDTRKGNGNGAGALAATMLLAGIAIGSLATILWQGARDATGDNGIGAGIRQLITGVRQPTDVADVADGADAQQAQPKESTEFTFFTVLPGIEVVAPTVDEDAKPAAKASVESADDSDDSDASQEKKQPVTAERVAPKAAQYMLQVGSFRRESDADRLKANLALQGMASAIQKVSIQGRGDFYRVHLGPYPTYQAMVRADERLAALGIETLRLKMNPG